MVVSALLYRVVCVVIMRVDITDAQYLHKTWSMSGKTEREKERRRTESEEEKCLTLLTKRLLVVGSNGDSLDLQCSLFRLDRKASPSCEPSDAAMSSDSFRWPCSLALPRLTHKIWASLRENGILAKMPSQVQVQQLRGHQRAHTRRRQTRPEDTLVLMSRRIGATYTQRQARESKYTFW